MEQRGQATIPSSKQNVWDALHDPEILKSCIDGCETLETQDDGSFHFQVTLKIGPVKSSFEGSIQIVNPQPTDSYTLEVSATGGGAGFGQGTADVKLTEVKEGTQLEYVVNGTIGGKLAQIGTRLVQSFSRKMADRFFNNFSKQWAK